MRVKTFCMPHKLLIRECSALYSFLSVFVPATYVSMLSNLSAFLDGNLPLCNQTIGNYRES